MITRRSFLAAPAIVTAASLMPVSAKFLEFLPVHDGVIREGTFFYQEKTGGFWVTGFDMYGEPMEERWPPVFQKRSDGAMIVSPKPLVTRIKRASHNP